MIIEYANRLALRGHQITLIAPGGTRDPDMQRELLPPVCVRESPVKRLSRMNIWQNLRLAWSLAATVPESDLIFSTHTPTTVAGWLAAKVRQRGRLAWLYQDFREMFAGRPYEDWLLRHALRWHECALAVSNYAKQELESYTRGKVIVVGEGLSHADLFRPHPAQAQHESNGPQTVLFLGDMRPRKGLFDFLEAALLVYQKRTNIRLLIVSKEECQIDSPVPFDFLHRPTRALLAQKYALCDLFVSASWRESFGLPPLEAMACGAPVVLTDSGGVREYARPGENCLMVPSCDPPALAEAMLRVLTNRELADQLRHNGPPTAARFTWESAVERFEDTLESLSRSGSQGNRRPH